MIRKYQDHKPQTNPWHREEELHNHHKTPERQIKQSNQQPATLEMNNEYILAHLAHKSIGISELSVFHTGISQEF